MRSPRPQIAQPILRAPDFFLGAAAAARVLGISVRRLYRMVTDRRILPDGFLEGEMRFRYSHLEDLVQNGLPGKYGRDAQASMQGHFPIQIRSGRS